jgi:N-acetylglucosaminyldiphosphoundecaprenol N-acetyl-beta-D-mannosaminyltransferase
MTGPDRVRYTMSAHTEPKTIEHPLPPAVSRQSLLGVPLALLDYESTLDWIDEAVRARRREYICVAAVHTVMASREDPDLREAVLGAGLTVPDGQPLVWALAALGHRLPDRVYGPELMDRYRTFRR